MTVGELKEMIAGLDDDIEVRLAMQPTWPFEYDISSVEVMDIDDAEPDRRVYLVEGRQIGYLPGDVTSQLGW